MPKRNKKENKKPTHFVGGRGGVLYGQNDSATNEETTTESSFCSFLLRRTNKQNVAARLSVRKQLPREYVY